MPKIYRVELTSSERAMLTDMVRRRSQTARPVRRAFMLLKADEADGSPAWPDSKIAESYEVSIRTVERLRERFVEEGLDGAVNGKKREPSRKKVFDGEVEAHLVALRCSAPPAGQAQWSLRLLRDKMIELEYVETISHESVRQLLKKNELKPWRVKSWVIPPGGDDSARAAFVCQMEQVLDVYARPYDRPYDRAYDRPGPARWSASTRRASSSSARSAARLPTRAESSTSTTNSRLRVQAGGSRDHLHALRAAGRLPSSPDYRESRSLQLGTRRGSPRRRGLLGSGADHTCAGQSIRAHKELSAHTRKALYEVYPPERARRILRTLDIVWTPVHGSWLNIAELELSVLARQCLCTRIPDAVTLVEQVAAWKRARNQMQKGVDWQFTTADARIKLKRLYPSIIT